MLKKCVKEEDCKIAGWDKPRWQDTAHWQSQPCFASTPTSTEAPDPDMFHFKENRQYWWLSFFPHSPYPVPQ